VYTILLQICVKLIGIGIRQMGLELNPTVFSTNSWYNNLFIVETSGEMKERTDETFQRKYYYDNTYVLSNLNV
jgi:hypothetical protein